MARTASTGSGHLIAKAAFVLIVLGVLFTVVFSLGWAAGLEAGQNESPSPSSSISVKSGETGD
jgi:hypothetical protein